MNWKVLPNVLTIARVATIPPLLWLLIDGHYRWALGLALIAGASDWLDGWLARRYGWQSRFGSLADPAADKLFMVASYLTLAWLGYLPWWLFVIVLGRDLVIVVGSWVFHAFFAPLRAEPTQLSRFNTFCQVFLIWFVLLRLAGFPLPPEAQIGLEWLVACMTTATLLQYVWLWSWKALEVRRQSDARLPRQ